MIVTSESLVSRFETFSLEFVCCLFFKKKDISLVLSCCTHLQDKSYRWLIFKQLQENGNSSASEETAYQSENQSFTCRTSVKENQAQRSTLLMPAPRLHRQDDLGAHWPVSSLPGRDPVLKDKADNIEELCLKLFSDFSHVSSGMCNTHANVYYIHARTHTQSKSKGGL